MALPYARHFSAKQTPQSEPIPGSNQVQNSAGGYAFPVDDWVRLDRFLLLGSEGGSYYTTERKLTVENAQAVQRCLANDGPRVVARIVEVSEAGRAPKNSPALFALALAASHKPSVAGINGYALTALPRVARTGTHIFEFAEYVKALRGWGRSLRRGVAAWYTGKEPQALAYQVTKYQQRNGWSHRDLLRLCHVQPPVANLGGTCSDGIPSDRDLHLSAVLHWAVKGWPGVGEEPHPEASLQPIWAMERGKRATSKAEIVRLVREYGLVRECVPTQWLTEAEVWDALLEKMPLTAMVRNLATMTRVGLLAPMSDATRRVVSELSNTDRLHKSRLHPIALLAALKTYAAGKGERGSNTWQPVQPVVDALDGAFYSAFGNVEPTGKRWLFGLDISGSMFGSAVAGMPFLDAATASAAMALVTAAVEPQHVFMAFTNQFEQANISPRQRLDDVLAEMKRLSARMAGTDCSLPMLHAAQRNIPVDVFVVLTDSETWAGVTHPTQALRHYRQQTGIPAKLIVCATSSNGFSVADPADAGQLDVVGFDTATPTVMADFAK